LQQIMIAHILVVVDASGDRLLVDRASGMLPVVRAPPVSSGEVAELNRSAHQLLGNPVFALRCLQNDINPTTRKPRHQVHLLESVRPLEAASSSWRAVDCEQIKPFSITPHAAIFDPVQAMQRHAARRPWWQPGFAQASLGWLEQTAPAIGAGRVTAVEQLRCWEFAWLVRVTTEQGSWYLKCSPPPLDIEADIVERLAEIRPQNVPHLAARYRAGSGFLMPAYSGPLLSACDRPAAWIDTAAEFARLQVSAIDATSDLVARGVPRRTSADLHAGIAELFGGQMNDMQRRAGIRDNEIETLRDALPRFSEMIGELDRLGVPLSIDHGDLWAPNVIIGAGGPRFLDWSDASIGHPFFSMLPLLTADAITAPLERDPRLRTRMRQAYLEPWQRLLGTNSLLRAWKLARPLAALQLAASYCQRILPLVDTEHQVYRTLGWFLRLAIRYRH